MNGEFSAFRHDGWVILQSILSHIYSIITELTTGMPLSRSRPRNLLRSFSASAVASDSDASATSSHEDQQAKPGNGRQRSSGGWTLPTLSTLANFNFHRRPRTKSEAKRKSVASKGGRSGSRERERERESERAAPVSGNLSPREQSPNNNSRLKASATTTESTPQAQASGASHSLPPSAPPAHLNTPSTVAADLEPAAIAPTTIDLPGAFPETPPRSKPDCPRVLVQRPSTPTLPTLDSGACGRYDLADAMQRKIWVKRTGGSATRVNVAADDLVDNVRDVILQKYANSLGRNIDSPDMILKIVSREQNNKNVSSERVLGPEESIGSTLDAYYPGGQNVDEALIIDVPQRRTTPRVSPRPGNHHIYYYPEQYRPDEAARGYFPPMQPHSPHLANVPHAGPMPHSMAILNSGQLPPLPSPGSHGQRRHPRPKYGRQHTSSPTILHTVQPNGQGMGTFFCVSQELNANC